MKKVFALLILLSVFSSFGQDIKIGIRDSLLSTQLNEKREFSIYLPPNYYTSKTQEFPVLYILDGDYNFRYVSGLLELEGGISERIPQMILVAISGKGSETYRKNCKPSIEGVEDKGNAEDVVKFLTKELIPYINSHYKTNNFNILSGHSVGGIFVINTALNHPQLFDQYIAISPALWWENNALNKVAERKIDGDFKTNVYISLADEQGMGVDNFLGVATSSILKNSIVIFGIAILGVLFAVFWGFKRRKIFLPLLIAFCSCGISAYLYFYYYPENNNFKFKQFPNENHNSVGEPTYRWALEDVFKTWQVEAKYFPSTETFKKHYEKVKSVYGTTFNIPYTVLGNTHYMLQDNPAEMTKFLTELKANYPQAYITFSIYRANKLLEENLNESKKIAEEILKKNPNSFDALQILSKVNLLNKEFVQAKYLIEKAIEKAHLQHARQWQLNELLETKKNIESSL